MRAEIVKMGEARNVFDRIKIICNVLQYFPDGYPTMYNLYRYASSRGAIIKNVNVDYVHVRQDILCPALVPQSGPEYLAFYVQVILGRCSYFLFTACTRTCDEFESSIKLYRPTAGLTSSFLGRTLLTRTFQCC